MAKKTSRLGRLWLKATAPDGQMTVFDLEHVDDDTRWRAAYRHALSAGQPPAMARRIADDVVRQLKARDNEQA